MTEVLISVGPKGQVLIPKSLREEYGISPYGKVAAKKEKGGILISRPSSDAISALRKTAFSGKRTAVNVKKFKNQFQEHFPKATLK